MKMKLIGLNMANLMVTGVSFVSPKYKASYNDTKIPPSIYFSIKCLLTRIAVVMSIEIFGDYCADTEYIYQ